MRISCLHLSREHAPGSVLPGDVSGSGLYLLVAASYRRVPSYDATVKGDEPESRCHG